MAHSPALVFKAGKCELTSSDPPTVKPDRTPGYIYLYIDDDLVHFCWRPRSAPAHQPEMDLLMIPGDGSFLPYTGPEGGADSDNLKSPTNGRIFALKFSSSSQRHLFWLQSKSQHPNGDASWFSERDQKLGQIVDMMLSGEEVDINAELQSIRRGGGGGGSRRDDDDETMEDVEGSDHPGGRDRHGSTGGAGADATGGDIREEGEESREGGADGGRAASAGNTDASAIVQNFLNSLKGGNVGGSSQQQQQKPFTTLPDLLPSSTTIPIIDAADATLIDALCAELPPTILLLAQEIDDLSEVDPTSETAQAAIEALSLEQKKDMLKSVLRSPQLNQSLGSLTVALRDGGLPNVSQALKIKVENGGYIKNGGVPMGGGDAVEAFLEGVKKTVEEEGSGESMDTS